MRVCVFTPTRLWGGFDITLSSLKRQQMSTLGEEPLFIWADDHWPERDEVISFRWDQEQLPWNFVYMDTSIKKPGFRRNLCQAYNTAMDIALNAGCDIFVSLQDYIWVTSDGIKMFVNDIKNNPNTLVTGITHIAEKPSWHDIYDFEGKITIFKEEFKNRPTGLSWQDCRHEARPEMAGLVHCTTTEFEINWAAWPISVFADGVRFDEKYDFGDGYDNQDFAERAKEEGYNFMLNLNNVALSFPHKSYFPEFDSGDPLYSNRTMHENKWGAIR